MVVMMVGLAMRLARTVKAAPAPARRYLPGNYAWGAGRFREL